MMVSPRTRGFAASTHAAQGGYVLITLILFVALLAIAMTALAPVMLQQLKRDREEELVHRGTQYSRAIKHYMKKMNSYPNRIEDLESANNIRYLRKRYKDPITGKDFKLLRFGDVQISSGVGLAGATSAAALAAGAGAAGNGLNGANTTGFGGSGVFGGGAAGNGGGNTGGPFGGNAGSGFGGGNSGGGFGGGNPSSGFGGGQGSSFGGANTGGLFGSPGQTANNSPGTGSDPNQPQGASGAPGGQGGFGQPVQGLSGFNSQGAGNQVIGGGPIVGVASTSKDQSIRSFGKKDHYKDWQFIYDPTTDRGGLITTPYQPPVMTASQSITGTPGANGTPGTNGNPGANGAPQSSPFGFGGSQPNSPGGFRTPQTPQMPPDQGPQ